jgi:hypothetical protein
MDRDAGTVARPGSRVNLKPAMQRLRIPIHFAWSVFHGGRNADVTDVACLSIRVPAGSIGCQKGE